MRSTPVPGGLSWNEAIAMIFRGEIKDAKTIVGLLWVDSLRRQYAL